MTKETFKDIIVNFNQVEKLVMRESYFSLDLMEDNIWIKEVTEFDDKWSVKKKYYNMKQVESNPEQVTGLCELKYTQHSAEDVEDLKKYVHSHTGHTFDDEMFSKAKYNLNFARKVYQHKENQDAKLTMDKVYFEDGDTFVVFSLEGNILNNDNDLSPCRSKIIELMSRTEDTKDIYQRWLLENRICDLTYVSMGVVEYKYGKEEENERKKAAEEFVQSLKNGGEKDEKYLAFIYREAVLNGVTESEYSPEDYL